jgi:hypothetical protein
MIGSHNLEVSRQGADDLNSKGPIRDSGLVCKFKSLERAGCPRMNHTRRPACGHAMEHPSFGRAIWRRWWALLSSAVLTIIGFYALMANKSAAWVIAADLIAAILLFYWASYGAWQQERRARLEAERKIDDGRPRFALEALDVDLHAYTRSDFFFWITNCGQRSARHVMFDPIRSRTTHHAIRFDTQPTLAPDKRAPLTFRCGGDDNWIMDGNVGRLLLFFEDNPKKEPTLRYDITVRFLDGDTALEEHHILQAELASGGAGARLKIYPVLAAAESTSSIASCSP